MTDFPFHIPQSLATYVEQFDDDPLKVTTKLKKHLGKRGPDAVGYFLLAWFYYSKGLEKQAIECALKAKTYAPGSPLMDKLHYYLSHPAAFDAWTPQISKDRSSHRYHNHNEPEPVLDLDRLIAKLSEIDSRRISLSEDDAGKESKRKAEVEDGVDDIASETLAQIHEQQGKIKEAIHTYRRLLKLNKDEGKIEYYEEQITRLNEKLKQD